MFKTDDIGFLLKFKIKFYRNRISTC